MMKALIPELRDDDRDCPRQFTNYRTHCWRPRDVLIELDRLRKKEHLEITRRIRNLWTPHLKVLIALIELEKATRTTLASYMLLDEVLELP
jgi:hypothetical protein